VNWSSGDIEQDRMHSVVFAHIRWFSATSSLTVKIQTKSWAPIRASIRVALDDRLITAVAERHRALVRHADVH
jgi:hypothetical protein